MIKLVLTDMDDTLIQPGINGPATKPLEVFIPSMGRVGTFGRVSGCKPPAMAGMVKNLSEVFSTVAFLNTKVRLVDADKAP